MKVLVACEYSGRVREAFRKLGHDAYSCDLLASEDSSPFHFTGDVLPHLNFGWDLMIAHPPCTHLAVSGSRHFAAKLESGVQEEALNFVRQLMNAPIAKICIENPVSVISSKIRKPEQIIQPFWFGEPEFKKTCLWLKGLPSLKNTNFLQPPLKGTQEWIDWNKVHRCPPGPDRWKERSRTYQGIAEAMASQWGI